MKTERKVIINGSDIVRVISLADIVYCQAEGNYCYVFTNNGRSILWCKRIGDVLKALNDMRFIKTSQSIILNRSYIGEVHKKRKEVDLILFEKKSLPYTIQLKEFLELIDKH